MRLVNLFTTGNPFLGTKLLGFSVGRGSGALKGLIHVILDPKWSECHSYVLCSMFLFVYLSHGFIHQFASSVYSKSVFFLGDVFDTDLHK